MIAFWLPVAAGVLIGKALGGSLASLAEIRLRHVWVAVVVVATQIGLVYAPPVPPDEGLDPLRVVLPLTTAAMAVFVVLNRRLPGMWLVLAGVLANLAVIVSNGGLMPTNADAMARAGMHDAIDFSEQHPGIRLRKSKDVRLEWDETRLPWLSDALVSPPVPRRKVFSAGDILVATGIATLTAQAMRGRVRLAGGGEPSILAISGGISSTTDNREEEQRGSPDYVPTGAGSTVGAGPAHPNGVGDAPALTSGRASSPHGAAARESAA